MDLLIHYFIHSFTLLIHLSHWYTIPPAELPCGVRSCDLLGIPPPIWAAGGRFFLRLLPALEPLRPSHGVFLPHGTRPPAPHSLRLSGVVVVVVVIVIAIAYVAPLCLTSTSYLTSSLCCCCCCCCYCCPQPFCCQPSIPTYIDSVLRDWM